MSFNIWKKVIPPVFVTLILFFLLCLPGFSQVNTERCHICGEEISGQYWILDDKVYCNDCFEKFGPRCDLCNTLLKGKYFIIPCSQKKFCEDCYNSYPACRSCGSPVGPEGVYIDSTRCLCPSCYSRAVFTHEELSPLYQTAVLELMNMGLYINKPVANLSIMEQNELDGYLGVPGTGESGFCQSWSNGYDIYAHRIYVLSGLPYEEALGVLCHELAHAWHAENNPSLTSSLLCEGFAEWVAYKVLVKKGYNLYAAKMYNNSDPVYGNGLRYMLDFESKYGTAATIEYIRTVKY